MVCELIRAILVRAESLRKTKSVGISGTPPIPVDSFVKTEQSQALFAGKNFGQVTPMNCVLCMDFVGTGGGWLRDRAAAEKCRELWRARETVFEAPTLGLSTPRWAAQGHAGIALYARCRPLVVEVLASCAMSLWEGRKVRAGAACCVPLRTLLYPETRSTGFVCVRVPRPQQHQHQTTMPPAAVSSPCILALALACSRGQTLYL